MDLRASFRDGIRWLRALGTNLYFWTGIGVLMGIGIGIYLVVDAMIMPSYTRHDASTTVPNVEGRPLEEADSLLRSLDLQVEQETGRYNPNVGQNIVVDQTPLPSSDVKPGRRVYLTVNAGEVPKVRTPDLTGMSIRGAKNRITSAGLRVGTVSKDPTPSPYANTITRQNPEPGDSLQEGRAVRLWYSTGLGEEEVEVPNVVGYTVRAARDSLLRTELRSVVVDTNLAAANEPDQPVDTESLERTIYVRKQGQPPGVRVRAGTEIRLFTTPDRETARSRRGAANDTTVPSDTTASSN